MRAAALAVRSDRRRRRGCDRARRSDRRRSQASRSHSMSRCCVMPNDLPWPGSGRPPRVRHAWRGVRDGVGNGPYRPGCRASRRSRWARTRGSGGARGSPAVRAGAVGTHDRAGPGRRRESRSSGAAGPSTGSTRRFAVRRRSRVAWAMQTLMRRRWSHASKRSGSRRPRRSRQAITSASWRASSARSMSRRIRWAIAKSRSSERGSGRHTPPDPRPAPPR